MRISYRKQVGAEMNNASQASCSNKFDASALDKCMEQSKVNGEQVECISNRILNLLERLGGQMPKVASCGGAGSPECSTGGVLWNHLSQLELQSQQIGSLQADLAALENLL